MHPNASFTCSELDSLRLRAIRRWAETIEQISSLHADIGDLARVEAARRYKDAESRVEECQFLPTLEKVRAAIETWATWQALELQVSRQDGSIGPMGLHNFIQDLEQILQRLTAPAALDDRFIL